MIDAPEFSAFTEAALTAAAEHRTAAMKRGFSQEAAEAMAVTLHSVLMAGLYEEEVDNPTPEE